MRLRVDPPTRLYQTAIERIGELDVLDNRLRRRRTHILRRQQGKVVAWLVGAEQLPFTVEPRPCRAERIRHHRKYAEGNLRYHSFYFRGPEGRLNLRAQNLWMFCQIAEGLDEQTWMFHLRRRDYSRWFRKAIRDEYLAQQTERIELRADLTWPQSRHLIRELVGARYTLPE